MTVIEEIAAERRRQIEGEGWTLEHDDKHLGGEMAYAAAWYVLNAESHYYHDMVGVADKSNSLYSHFAGKYSWCKWPWSLDWWKPKSPRRDLIRAAALIVAEVERLDRLEEKK